MDLRQSIPGILTMSPPSPSLLGDLLAFSSQASGTLYLVACVAKKLNCEASAADLYQSDWFKKARAYVEAQGAPWRILSARYGLVAPHDWVKPYEQTLNAMTAIQRRAWAQPVLQGILHLAPREVVFLAGRKYRENLTAPLVDAGVQVMVPMAGLGIGEQLGWLKSHGPAGRQ